MWPWPSLAWGIIRGIWVPQTYSLVVHCLSIHSHVCKLLTLSSFSLDFWAIFNNIYLLLYCCPTLTNDVGTTSFCSSWATLTANGWFDVAPTSLAQQPLHMPTFLSSIVLGQLWFNMISRYYIYMFLIR